MKSTIDRKTQILTEATRLFSEYGYDKVTIKTLAEACGITEPALYRHYKSKDDIYDTVLDSLEERLRETDEFFDNLVIMASVIPSLKYSCSGSPLMFSKGKTAMEGFSTGATAFSVTATSGGAISF